MAAESSATKEQRLANILRRLKTEYPNAHCSLNYKTPFQLLVATILSAQCTDERVNIVTADLFRKYTGPKNFANLSIETLGKAIYSTGFYNNKAKSIHRMSRVLLDQYQGKVPQTLAELVKLPGVGRKTANVVLGNAFGIPGLTVDTHVTRITNLLGLAKTRDAVKIEKEFMKIMAREDWTLSAHLFISHGRAVCIARRPRCADCVLTDLCPGKPNGKKI